MAASQVCAGLSIINAEDAVALWNEEMNSLDESDGFPQAFTTDYDPRYVINWSKVKITHSDPHFYDVISPKKSKAQIVSARTIYNRGTSGMTHTCSASRRQSIRYNDVRISQGLSVPVRSILPMPDALSAAYPGTHLILKNEEVEMTQDDLTWKLQDEIVVGSYERLHAKMTIEEKQWEGSFTVTTKLKGKVVVTVYNGDKFVVTRQGDVSAIFQYAKHVEHTKYQNMKIKNGHVECYTSGTMSFRYSVNHTLDISSNSLGGGY